MNRGLESGTDQSHTESRDYYHAKAAPDSTNVIHQRGLVYRRMSKKQDLAAAHAHKLLSIACHHAVMDLPAPA